MAKQGDTIKFRSRNDGQVHEGQVQEVATGNQVRQTFGGDVLRVSTPGRGRGWELVSDADVQS